MLILQNFARREIYNYTMDALATHLDAIIAAHHNNPDGDDMQRYHRIHDLCVQYINEQLGNPLKHKEVNQWTEQ